jgi:hypothetical protein
VPPTLLAAHAHPDDLARSLVPTEVPESDLFAGI